MQIMHPHVNALWEHQINHKIITMCNFQLDVLGAGKEEIHQQ